MPITPHTEKHFTAGETIRDIVIGMSDGLTVPFALAAGLSGAVSSTAIIITAGFAEIAAGAVAMGLGGYLAAKSDAEHYASELQRERREIVDVPAIEEAEVAAIFRSYGLSADQALSIVNTLRAQPEKWVEFMMRHELGLEQPDPSRALKSAATIATAYIAGGIIPLSPYLFTQTAPEALKISVVLTLFALLIFGYIKGRFTGSKPIRSAIQTMIIGGVAAAVAFAIARLIG